MTSKQGKILVISDIHGNAEGLKAVLKRESDYDFLVFLGDSVLSGPQPKETAEILLDVQPDINIMGNHDEILLDHVLIDKWPEDWRAYNQWAFKQIPSEIIETTKTYSFSGKYEIGGMGFFLHHGQLIACGVAQEVVDQTGTDNIRDAFQKLIGKNSEDITT